MRTFLRSTLPLIFLTACGAPTLSENKAIFVESSIRLIDAEERDRDENAKAIGALLEVIDIDGELITKAYCNAVRISPRHILTAAHCEKPGRRIVFAPHYLSASSDASKLEFASLPTGPRLMFVGELDAESKANSWAKEVDLGTAIYSNKTLDFAIFDLGYSLGEGYAQLPKVDFENKSLRLYGFPNGSPLTVAEDCTGEEMFGILRHDCDSLTGSSGGIVVDATGALIALHTFSAVVNKPGDGIAVGLFEDHAAIEARSSSIIDAKGEEAKDKMFWECRDLKDLNEKRSCQIGKGLNRAIFISTILDDIETHAPLLHQDIFGCQQDRPINHPAIQEGIIPT